jgi:hypothetical protein
VKYVQAFGGYKIYQLAKPNVEGNTFWAKHTKKRNRNVFGKSLGEVKRAIAQEK